MKLHRYCIISMQDYTINSQHKYIILHTQINYTYSDYKYLHFTHTCIQHPNREGLCVGYI